MKDSSLISEALSAPAGLDKQRPLRSMLNADFVLVALLAVFSVPILFQILRTTLFHTIPFDDYAPFLATILGYETGLEFRAPMHYRVLSVAPAAVFWHLPLISFSELPALDPLWQRATQSLALWNWSAVLLTSVTLYFVTRRAGCGYAASFAVGLAALLLAGFIALTGVDGPFVLAVTLLALSSARPWTFVLMMVCAPLINEKLALVFMLQYGGRTIFGWFASHKFSLRSPDFALAVVSAASFALYLVIRSNVAFPGNESQLTLSSYGASFVSSILLSISLKGVVLNILPVAIILGGYSNLIANHIVRDRFDFAPSFAVQRCDLVLPLGLLFIALVTSLNFNIGRVVISIFPLLLPSLGALLSNRDGR